VLGAALQPVGYSPRRRMTMKFRVCDEVRTHGEGPIARRATAAPVEGAARSELLKNAIGLISSG
jgi:hypothetical protein